MKRYISQSMYEAAPAERAEELEQVKENIYKANLDSLTSRMSRKKAQGTWTDEDQKHYDEAYQKCKDLISIEEAKPLFNPDEELIILSDEDYKKKEEEHLKKQEAERMKAEAEQQQAEGITPPQIEAIAEAKKANLQKAIEEAPAKKKTTKNTK